MAISKARKDELVAQYIELLNNSNAVFMADYTGMSVKNMEALREEVRKVNGAFHVTKNTLLRHALEESNMPVPEGLLAGQVATGFALDAVPPLAKALVDYAKKDDKFDLKGGIVGIEALSADGVKALADLPTLPELRAQLLGLISAPARNVASVVAGGVRQVVNVLDAYAKSEDAVEAA